MFHERNIQQLLFLVAVSKGGNIMATEAATTALLFCYTSRIIMILYMHLQA